MEQKLSFRELIVHLCHRPNMYTLEGSFIEVAAFIDGYTFQNDTPISGRLFSRYVCLKNSFPSNYVWPYVIKNSTKNDAEALALTEAIILEFIELKDQLTEDELMLFAVNHSRNEEGEAEKTFRKFDQALLLGNQQIIQSLIMEHKDASVLWAGAYPNDIRMLLDEVALNQPIKKVYESEDKRLIKIISSGWPFPIEMNYLDGKWKVDASNIIELRLQNKDAE